MKRRNNQPTLDVDQLCAIMITGMKTLHFRMKSDQNIRKLVERYALENDVDLSEIEFVYNDKAIANYDQTLSEAGFSQETTIHARLR